MSLNSILKIFLPKDRVFYLLFENVAEVLVKMGDKVVQIINEPDYEERAKLIKEVDDRALRTEWEELIRHPLPMEFKGLPRLRAEAPLQPKDAYNRFLLTFAQLSDIKLPRLEAPR